MFKLAIQSGPLSGTEVLLDASSFSVGRHKMCGLQIPDRGVSRKHATLHPSGQGHTLHDAQSNNGTLVNGRRIHWAKLCPGDQIQVGKTLMIYCDQENASAAPRDTRRPEARRKPRVPSARRSPVLSWSLAGHVALLIVTIIVGRLLFGVARGLRRSRQADAEAHAVPDGEASPAVSRAERPSAPASRVHPAPQVDSVPTAEIAPTAESFRLAEAKRLIARAEGVYRGRTEQSAGAGWDTRALDDLRCAEVLCDGSGSSRLAPETDGASASRTELRRRIQKLRLTVNRAGDLDL